MPATELDIVILGLSITSSWGNGHATTYRSLIRGLAALGHRVLFLERDVPWYAQNRDLEKVPYADAVLYGSLDELRARHQDAVRGADLVIVGSFVPDGPEIIEWVLGESSGIVAFYDIDTPVTLAAMARGDHRHLTPSLIPCFDLYLSFTGGPMLRHLEEVYGAALARPLYCAVDDRLYFPENRPSKWDLGYLGTYSEDRQPALDRLLLHPARQSSFRFAVAGPMYPSDLKWPDNVDRFDHLAPGDHREFYNSQRFTLNLTRADMMHAGYSPSVRIFEAAACGTCVISDRWPGLEDFFTPGVEILVASSGDEVLYYLHEMSNEERNQIAAQARSRVLAHHTGVHRAEELVEHFNETKTREKLVSPRAESAY